MGVETKYPTITYPSCLTPTVQCLLCQSVFSIQWKVHRDDLKRCLFINFNHRSSSIDFFHCRICYRKWEQRIPARSL